MMNDDSILITIKKMLGISAECSHFDTDVTININSSIGTLRQLGIGPNYGFVVKSDKETWEDYLGNDTKLESVKLYIFLKSKIVFDPPQSSIVMDCYKEQIRELEWRLNRQVDPPDTFE